MDLLKSVKQATSSTASLVSLDVAEADNSAGTMPVAEEEMRCRSAWIPSTETVQFLLSRPQLDQRKSYVMPGVLSDEILGDPVRDLAVRFLGEAEAARRSARTASVPETIEGLQRLIAAGNLRQAMQLSAKLLTAIGQGIGRARQPSQMTEYALKLWTCRFSLMMRLQMFTAATNEMELFGNLDSPDLYMQYYPEVYGQRRGSLVPFTMRLIHAELPQYSAHADWCFARLSKMLTIIQKMLDNVRVALGDDSVPVSAPTAEVFVQIWSKRRSKVLSAMANALLRLKDYKLCLQVLETVSADAPHLLSDIGRACIQMGDYGQATVFFKRFSTAQALPVSAAVQAIANTGYLAIFHNDYVSALDAFKKANQASNGVDYSLINNLAVCHLYLGQLDEAVRLLEDAVHKNPEIALHEGLVLNLCTLYELASARSMHMKQNVLALVSLHRGDVFNAATLKMSG